LLIVKNICYSSSGISFLLTFLFLFRIVMSKAKTHDLEELKNNIKLNENNKIQFQDNLREIKEKSIINEKKIKESQKNTISLNKDIETLREKLLEPYVEL
jgi:hypothetical protein